MKTGRPSSLPVSYVDDEVRDYSGRHGGLPLRLGASFHPLFFFGTLLLLMARQQPFLPLTYEYGQVSLVHVPLMVS